MVLTKSPRIRLQRRIAKSPMDARKLGFSKAVSRPAQFWLLLAALNLVFLVGCGDGRPRRVPISGVVTIDGKPVPFGSVMLVPADGSRTGGGSLDSDGLFRVSTYTAYDGMPPGTYDVSIAAIETLSETKQRWHAPEKYADVATSGLSIEIDGKTDQANFELTWEGDEHSEPFIEKLR